jgi:hypothetical protein
MTYVCAQELGVPEVQIHEPVLALSHAAELKADFESSFKAFATAGVQLHLVSSYDDVGAAYPWVVTLPVQVRIVFPKNCMIRCTLHVICRI